MKVTIYGSGYVGLVTGACLAQVGNTVICVDTDKEKINASRKKIFQYLSPAWKKWWSTKPGQGNI